MRDVVPKALRFDGVIVVGLELPSFSDETWYAKYVVDAGKLAEEPNSAVREASSYLNFCVTWNKRISEGEDPDPDDFEQFTDLMKSGRWTVYCEGGSLLAIEGAPVFYPDFEVSWIPLENSAA